MCDHSLSPISATGAYGNISESRNGRVSNKKNWPPIVFFVFVLTRTEQYF